MEKNNVTAMAGNGEMEPAELVNLDVDGLEWEAGMFSQKESELERIFAEYEKLCEEKTEFDIKFATASALGKLSIMDGPVRIRMNPQEMDGPVWSTRTRALMKDGRKYTTMLLAKTYRVRVVKVDREHMIVFVSERAAHEDLKKRVIDKITELLSTGKHVAVPARVIGVCPHAKNLIMISVGDIGIPGVIRKSEWARSYISNFEEAAKPGKMITVAVTGGAKWNDAYGIHRVDKNSHIYTCSRAEAMLKDPWEGVEEHYPVKTGVRVRCVHVAYERFFGEIDGLEDINALCVISDNADVTLEIGREYLGYVYMVNEKEHKLKIRIIEELAQESIDAEEELSDDKAGQDVDVSGSKE